MSPQILPSVETMVQAQDKPTCNATNCGTICLACYGTCDNCHSLIDLHDLFPIESAFICRACYYRYFDLKPQSKTEKKFWKNFKG